MAKPTNDQPKRSGKARERQERLLAAQRRTRRRRWLFIGGAAALALAIAGVLVALNLPSTSSDDDAAVSIPTFVPTPATTVPMAAVPSVSAPEATPTARPATATDTPRLTPTPTAQVAATGYVIGDPSATVHVIEWGDYQCPYCGLFTRTYEQELFDDYVATGKITFEFRDFPFLDRRVNGSESHDAAEAAACADDQGKFWEYHLTLYNNQGTQENNGAFAPARLIQMARGLGLDVDVFTTCLESGTHAAAVVQSATDARAAGINSTPTFLINDQVVVGAKWDAVKQAIDAALGE